MFLRAVVILAVGCASSYLHASPSLQAEPKDDRFLGAWQGTMDVGVTKLRLQFLLREDAAGKWSGKMVSVDQGETEIPFDSVSVDDGKLVTEVKNLQLSYEGTFNDDRSEISGTLTQFGRKFAMDMEAFTPSELKLVSTWQGTMKAGSRTFEFQIRIYEDDNAEWVGKLDSLSENLTGLAMDEIVMDGKTFSFQLPATMAAYKGAMNQDRGLIEGKWIQSGGEFELNFKKIEADEAKEVSAPNRPQNPEPPFPYLEIKVVFENVADDVRLAGTLTIPEDAGQHPAVILISGSGPQDRDETLMGHKPFWVLADHLTRQGYAVLRYDERGVGESTGKFAEADSRDLARDVEAAIDFLKNHESVDPDRIGLIGHSEGGLIAPMISAQRNDVAAIVLMAGPGVTGREIIVNQTDLILTAEGVAEDHIAMNSEIQEKILALAIQDLPENELKTAIDQAVEPYLDRIPESMHPNVRAEAMMSMLSTPWFRFFLKYDPRPALQQTQAAVLALNGSKDLQVDPKLNLPEIREALEANGQVAFEIREFENLNHLFQSCTTGSPTEYSSIEETIAPVVLETIVDFLDQHLN